MAAPNGFINAAFNNNTVGQNGVAIRHVPARTTLLAQAEAILRQPNQPITNVQGLATATGVAPGQAVFPNPLAYEEVLIFHPTIANYLSQIFCFAVRIYFSLI
jgi:hypothetical protein